MRVHYRLLILSLIVFFIAGACATAGQSAPAAESAPAEEAAAPAPMIDTIIFSDLNWTKCTDPEPYRPVYCGEGLWAIPRTLFSGSTLPLFQGLRKGDTHVTLEIWLPNQDEAWYEALGNGEVVELGASLGKDWQSFFVIPAYLQEEYPDLDSVEDLKDEKFKELFASGRDGRKGASCLVRNRLGL